MRVSVASNKKSKLVEGIYPRNSITTPYGNNEGADRAHSGAMAKCAELEERWTLALKAGIFARALDNLR